MMENVRKIKIKLENIWIDLIRSIYAPYIYKQSVGASKKESDQGYATIKKLYNSDQG